jgi:NADPH:quinone reductase-like Zn-dependent oxidoreductase
MKAVLFHNHGGPEVLEYAEFPTPKPGTGEVLVRLVAAALNRLDLWVREGWPGIKLQLPHIPGADGAGTVAEVGEGVTQWKEGDRVVINANLTCGECSYCISGRDNLCKKWQLLGETTRGTYAEYIALPARNLIHVPDDFSLEAAAAAALVYQTAWHSLITRGNLKPGETVLIVGASGGVNTASIQIARFTGADVIVVGSGAEKLELARSLGANQLIDRSKEESWSKAVFEITGKQGVDVVVDNVGSTFMQSFRAAKKGGRILTVGNSGGPKVEIDNRFMFSKHLSLLGSSMASRGEVETVLRLVFEGKLKPVIDRTYPLAEAAAAQGRLAHGEQRGKIVLAI